MDDSSRSGVSAANNAAAADPNWKYEKLGVGDIVYRDWIGHTHQEGVFGQLEYSILNKKFNFVLAGSISNTGYWRVDHFNYDKAHEKSEKLTSSAEQSRAVRTTTSTVTTTCSSTSATSAALHSTQAAHS